MSANSEIREKAQLFGWSVNTFPNGETFVRGNHYVNVDYSRTGAVTSAELRSFASLAGSHPLLDRTADRHKKERVLSWLAA